MKRKRTTCIAIIIIASLSAVLICDGTVRTQIWPAAQSTQQGQPAANYVNPAAVEISEYKAMNMTDSQITAALATQGIGWDPQTGAAWIGVLIPANQTNMPQVVNPFAANMTAPASQQLNDSSP